MKTSSTIDSQTPEAIPVDAVYAALESSPTGLSQADAEQRLRHYGRNALREPPRPPLWRTMAAHFTHLMALLLWVGGLVGFIAQMPQLGVAIWMVNVINGAFSFWQEYKAEQATAALRRMLPQYARVRRNGEEQRIEAEELVPGDVLLLTDGDHISADARLVRTSELRVDQSTLSGESHPVQKTVDCPTGAGLARVEQPNLVFAGTSVASGVGEAVVFATGMQTQFGTIAHLTQTVGAQLSPLQIELSRVTRVVTMIAVGIGCIFFVLAIALAGMDLASGFIFAMGMIVAFVPEGLLPTVTLALAMSTQRMARRHALVKRLSAVETLGCTTVICTDKTGTLTQNEMTVREIWLPEQRVSVSGAGYAPEGQFYSGTTLLPNPAINTDLHTLLAAAALCNDSRLLPPDAEHGWSVLGDPTEAALLVVARKAGIDLEAEARQAPRIRELPFDSRRKRMSTVHRVATGNRASMVAYVKGAPREMLALCTHIQCGNQVVPLSDDYRAAAIEANDEYARGGLRVLAVAMRSLSEQEGVLPSDAYTTDEIECNVTLLGLIAMLDPPRPEVEAAVETCRSAGIRIIMITGDYGLTAESIARRIKIVKSDHPRIITGVELDSMDEPQLATALAEEVIFARVAPEHKLRVVTALHTLGEVVAVTGDGVNDAPALKQADIGVAMGITGTDVAKEAADMILTDDNFASIVNAVEEGRTVYANIKKFTTYIFTSNAPEAVPFVFFAFSGGRIPLALNVMQVLAVDLGTDIMPALALGAEAPEAGIMERPPRDQREHVINGALLRRAYVIIGPVQGIAAMAAFFYQFWVHNYTGSWLNLPAEGTLYQSATAMALAAVVVGQVGNLFAQRSERTSFFRTPLFTNRLIWIGIAVELTLILLIVYVPFFQDIFGTAAFAPINWLFLWAWAPIVLLVDELRKLLARRRS